VVPAVRSDAPKKPFTIRSRFVPGPVTTVRGGFVVFQAQEERVPAVQHGGVRDRLQPVVVPRLRLLLRFSGLRVARRSHRQVKRQHISRAARVIKINTMIFFFSVLPRT